MANIQRPYAGAADAATVTPTDDVELDPIPRALWVGTAGNLTVILKNMSTTIAFNNIQAGTMIELEAKEVRATGTTASDIVAVW